MYKLGDVFIGDHPIIEYFGSSPAIYNARYGLQGYPGLRVKCPSLTPVLSGADGFVLETGFEEAGKGRFITIVHDGYLTTYGHLNDILVQKDEKVIAGQLIAHSNQSGLAEFPCLYFGIAPCDGAGTKTLNNGYGGYIDPLDDTQVQWEVKNLQEPAIKSEVLDKMTLDPKEYTTLNAQATNYKVIIAFLQQHTGFDEYLKEVGHAPVNLNITPDDSAGGEAVSLYLHALSEEFEKMEQTINELTKESEVPEKPAEEVAPVVKKKPNFLTQLSSALIGFFWVQK
jgi:hypothetical protein